MGTADPVDEESYVPQDRTQTCGLGAVNAERLRAHPDADECDDGCGWKSEACLDGECMIPDGKGGIDESCTHRTKPLFE